MAFAQGELPGDGLVGFWTFDNAANLTKATVGNDLEIGALAGLTPTFTAVSGPVAGNGAVNVATGSFYKCYHDIEANGFDPAYPDSVPTRVNRFSLVIDFRMPSTGVWYAFHATDNNGDPTHSDWESFIRSNGPIGVGSTGYSFYAIKDTENWYRMVINADLGVHYKYFLDGQLTKDGSTRHLDDRFSLDSPDGTNAILFFGDDDGEDAAIDIAQLAIYDRPLTDEEISELGGYGHFIPYGLAVGAWDFNDATDLLAATSGKPLELVGTHVGVAGPTEEDLAASIGVGSHYRVSHDIVANGFALAGEPTVVNSYTVVMDVLVPVLGKYYALLQTDPENLDDADLFINPEGRIGSALIGWSDSTIVRPDEWYRISLAVSQGDTLPNAVIFADGEKVITKDVLSFNDDLALAPKSGANALLFFADDNGDDNQLSVANVNIYNRTLSNTGQENLGGYDHKFSTENTVAKQTPVFKLAEATQYAKAPYSDDFDIPEDRSFTVECWVQIGKGISSDPSILSNKDWDSGGNNGWNLAAGSGTWDINIADEGRIRIDFDPPTLNDGQWHHIGFSITRETASDSIFIWTDNNFSVNLLFAAGFTAGHELHGIINHDNFPLCFGQDGTEKYPPKFPGSIDEVRIWHAALDKETLAEWRHKPVTSDHPYFSSLVGYWNFDAIVDGAYPDLSGKGRHAVLVNGPFAKVSYAVLGGSAVAAQTDLAGIWGAKTAGGPGTMGESGGLTLSADFDFETALGKLISSGEEINEVNLASALTFETEMSAVFGHNNGKGVSTGNLPTGVVARYEREWLVDLTETWNQVVGFDFNMTSDAGAAENYVLLTRKDAGSAFEIVAATATVFGPVVTFEGVTLAEGALYTLGTKNESASPLGNLTNIDSKTGLPLVFALENAYPNPFNPQTTIEYSLAKISDVKLNVYNALGQVVATVVDVKAQPAGQYKATWNALNVPSGIYFYRIHAGKFQAIKKVILLK
jgi:hypothetical protein